MSSVEIGGTTAVAVCGYSEFTGLPGGDPNNYIQLRALEKLTRAHPDISVIIFPTGVGKPTIGQQLAKQFQQLQSEATSTGIIVTPPETAPSTTIGETDAVREILPPYINHVIFLGIEDHTGRIAHNARGAFRKRPDITVEVMSSDQILRDGHRETGKTSDGESTLFDPHVNHVVFELDKWRASELDQARARRERLVSRIDRLPGSRTIFQAVNSVTRGSRGLNQALLGRRANHTLNSKKNDSGNTPKVAFHLASQTK